MKLKTYIWIIAFLVLISSVSAGYTIQKQDYFEKYLTYNFIQVSPSVYKVTWVINNPEMVSILKECIATDNEKCLTDKKGDTKLKLDTFISDNINEKPISDVKKDADTLLKSDSTPIVVTEGKANIVGGINMFKQSSGEIYVYLESKDVTLKIGYGTLIVTFSGNPPDTIHYWRMDGNSNDVTGGYNGVDTAMTYRPGKINLTAQFDGRTSYISLTIGSPSANIGNTFTFTSWIKINSTTPVKNTIIHFRDGSIPNSLYFDTESRKITFRLYDNAASTSKYYSGATTLSTQTWYMVAATWDGTNLKVYVNGVEDTPYTKTEDSAITRTLTDNVGYIGKNATNLNWFNGSIDDLKIFSRVLTSSELVGLYTNLQQINNCTGYGSKTITYSIYDEKTPTTKIKSNISGSYNYYYGSVSGTMTTEGLNQNNFSICVNPNNAQFNITQSVTYLANGYSARNYATALINISNKTRLVTLYLLSTTYGGTYTIKTVDSYQNAINGVIVSMYKKISGTYTLMESRSSDSVGVTTFFVDPTTEYNFTFVKSGYKSQSLIILPTLANPLTVVMVQNVVSNVSLYAGVKISHLPASAVLSNKSSYLFSFVVNSSYWNITRCNMTIKNSTGVMTSYLGKANNLYCNATRLFTTSKYTDYVNLTGWYEVNRTINITYSYRYLVKYTYVGNFSLKTFINDINNFTGSGFNAFTRMFLGFIIILFIMGWLATYDDYYKDPITLMMILSVLLWIVSLFGFFNITNSPFEFVNKYAIAILVSLVTMAYYIQVNR